MTMPSYGNPYCYGNNIPDSMSFPNTSCNGFIPSRFTLLPHSSPAGIAFYTGIDSIMFNTLKNKLLICEYGSSLSNAGYRVSFLDVDNSSTIAATALLSGYMATTNGSSFIWGRPTGILISFDGAILISDDKSGTIIRISALPSNLAAYILILVAIFLSLVTAAYILFHNLCLGEFGRSKKVEDAYVEFEDEKGKNTIPAVELQ